MKKLILIITFSLIIGVSAQELVTLTTPIAKTTTNFHVSSITLDVDNLVIVVYLTGNNNERLIKQYDSSTTPSGATLLHSLNTTNFSTNSLIKAVYNRLITDGVITGTISGLPQ